MNPWSPVHSFDEWSRLREVIVGDVDGWRGYDLDSSFAMFYCENLYALLAKRRRHCASGSRFFEIPDWILCEIQEDVEGFVSALQEFGVTVLRPAKLAQQAEIVTPYWRSRTVPALNVRDQTIILGTTIVETSPHVRARIFENDQLKPIFYRYFEAGSNWVTMPRPTLGRGSLDPSYFLDQRIDIHETIEPDDAHGVDSLGYEMIFDGAQCVRLGEDVLVNIANRNHELGFRWLQRMFADRFRFHRIERCAEHHLDTKIVALRPGLLILRSPEHLQFLPRALHGWDIIYPPDIEDTSFPQYDGEPFYLASKYIETNLLSLDENTVIVNALYPSLIRVLERRGFTVVPVRHRHGRLIGGGFHCLTLDCVRDGGCESYLH